MSFFARVFSLIEDVPSRSSICEDLLEAGYEFATAPGKEDADFKDADWTFMDFQYQEGTPLIQLERNTREIDGELFEDEIKEFMETIAELPYGKNTKKVTNVFTEAKQIFAFKLEEEMNEDGWGFLEDLMDFLCDSTDGYVQIDGEGMYDKDGRLMLEFE